MPTMLDAIKLYVTSILKAMELKDPIEERVVMKLVDAIFTETFDKLIELKIAQDQRKPYADKLVELLKSGDQEGYLEFIKPLGTNDEISKQVMATANDLLMKLIDNLQSDGYITEENLNKLQEYIANPKDLIEFDQNVQRQPQGI